MSEVTIIVREAARLKPDYSLSFELPSVPSVGDYISITRPDTPEPWSEDVVVRKVWWRLAHPETATVTSGAQKVGKVTEVFVECDIAEGPYASDHWRKVAGWAREKGANVETFEVERFSVRQSDLPSDSGS